MDKCAYRSFFQMFQPIIKFNYFCNMCNVDSGNLSKFINGDDDRMSLNSLESLFLCIKNHIVLINYEDIIEFETSRKKIA